MVIAENIVPRNVIMNRGAAEVDNYILGIILVDYHSLRECNNERSEARTIDNASYSDLGCILHAKKLAVHRNWFSFVRYSLSLCKNLEPNE